MMFIGILFSFLAMEVKPIEEMEFTELEAFAEETTGLIYTIGIALTVVCIAWVAFLLILSNGNQKKIEAARSALIGIALGVILLIGAPRIAEVIQSLSPFGLVIPPTPE